MRNGLFRLIHPLSDQALVDALRDPSRLPVESIPEAVDLSVFDARLAELTEADVRESALDTQLVEPLHRALRHLPDSATSDMRMWHWFCVVRHPDLVWRRWRGATPADPEEGFLRGQGHRPVPGVRFLGTASINGQGRNTFARLFFAAHRLIGSDGEDYDLVRRLFTSQELHLGISDREYGLLPAVNRVLTRELADLPDLKVRTGVRRLNALGGSLCLDLLGESEIAALIIRQENQESD
jgi:hypothetical protein